MKKLALIVASFAMILLVCGCTSQGSASSNATSSATASTASSATASNAASSSENQTTSSSVGIKNYTIVHVDSEPNWDDIAQLDINDAEWTDSFGISAHAKLCYSDQAMYVHMWADEQDVRATYTPDDPLAKCYEDSCLEFFVAPLTDDARYLNFEFNPNCAVCNEIGTQKENRIRLLPPDGTFNSSSSLTENGWEITYQIPFDYIRELYPSFNPESGMQMHGNFYKCGNLTTNKHYLVWNHVDSETPNFHVPSSFGILMFE